MTGQLDKLIFRFLKVYGVSISKHEIEQAIYTHPDYPSIRCISDALDSWKVKHLVIKLSLEKLQALDVPVIAPLKKGEFVWVTQVTNAKVYYRRASGKERITDKDRFEKEWTGEVLAIEDVTNAGEPDYREKRKKEIKQSLFRYAVTGGCIVLLILLTFFSWTDNDSLPFFPKLLLLFVNVSGCCIGYLLIMQEKQQSNRLVRAFCKAGAHIDCHEVTKSQYSKLFGLISWVELGMAYFVAVVFWVCIAPISPYWLQPLYWLSLVSLPFTVWSLFTQAFLIRKWCLFCCAIVLFLWINACILYLLVPFSFSLPLVESSMLALLLPLCFAATANIGKTLKHGNKYSGQRETARIIYDYKTLKGQLADFQYETGHAGLVIGNSQSSHEITLYVSIACSFCGAAVKQFSRLTEIFPTLGYRLIFAVNTDDFEHRSNIIIRHFLSLYTTLNRNDFFLMLDAWYTEMNKKLETLQKEYPVITAQDGKEEIETLYQFSQMAKIGYTPAILINGRLLSQLYSYGDLYGIARSLNAEEQ